MIRYYFSNLIANFIFWIFFLNARFLLLKQMAALVTDYMEEYGTKFAWKCIPKRVEKLPSGVLQVTWTDVNTSKEHQDTYDSVLWAVGETVCCNGHVNLVFINWPCPKTNLKVQTENCRI